jgi:uncharacterized membrane protein
MNSTDKALNFYMPGIAIVFVSLALPVQLSGYWISVAWIIEAVLLYAVSFVAFRDSMRVFGAIVYTLGVLRFFTVDLPQITDLVSFIPIFNKYFFIVLLAILGAYAIAFCYKKAISPESKDSFKKGVAAFIIVAQVLTVYLGIFEIMAHYSKREALYERDFWKSMEVYGEYRTGGYVSCGYRNRFGWSTQSYNEYHQYRPPASQRLDSNGQYIYTPPAQPDERTQSEINTRCAEREAKFTAMSNQRNLWVSIFLVLYAVLLAVAGFVFNVRLFRLLGILLFFITAFKIFTDVWSLGQVYRIISSITFGVLALAISFVYTKWKSRLKEIL